MLKTRTKKKMKKNQISVVVVIIYFFVFKLNYIIDREREKKIIYSIMKYPAPFVPRKKIGPPI